MSSPNEPITMDPTTDATADTSAAPGKSNEQKVEEFAKKYGIITKFKKMVFKKLGLTPKAAAAH